MKKVGKEFRKSLSAILAAAMVVSSMPETSLVANAEEVDAQEQSYELDDSIVDNGESAKFAYTMQADIDQDSDGNTATVKYALGWDYKDVTEGDYHEFSDEAVRVKATQNPYIRVTPKTGYTIDKDGVYFYTSEDFSRQELQKVADGVYSIPVVSGGVTVTIVVETSHKTIKTINAKLDKSDAADLTVKDVNNSDTVVDNSGILKISDAKTLDFTVTETDKSGTNEVKSIEVTYNNKKLTAQLVDSATGKYQVDLSGVYGEEADKETVDLTVKVTEIAVANDEFTGIVGSGITVNLDADAEGVVIDDIKKTETSKLELVTSNVSYTPSTKDEEGVETVPGKLTVDLSLNGNLASYFDIDQVKIETVKAGDNKTPNWEGTKGFVEYGEGAGEIWNSTSKALEFNKTLENNIGNINITVKVKRKANVIYVKDDNDKVTVQATYDSTAPAAAISTGTELPAYFEFANGKYLYLSFTSTDPAKQVSSVAGTEAVEDESGAVISNLYKYTGTISATTGDIVLSPVTEAIKDKITITNDDNLTAEYRVVDKEPSYDDAEAAFAGTTGKVTEKTEGTGESATTFVEAERGKYLIVRVRDGIEVTEADKFDETPTDDEYDYYKVLVNGDATLAYAIARHNIIFDVVPTGLKYKYSTDAEANWKDAEQTIAVKENSTINFKWEPKKTLDKVNKLTYTIGEDEVTEYGEVSQLATGTVTGNDKFTFDVVVDHADANITGFSADSVNRAEITTDDADNTYKISNDKTAITNAVTKAKGYYVASDRDLYVQVTLKDNKKTATGLTLGSNSATLVSENLFKIDANKVTNGALVVTEGEVANSIKVTNDTTNKKVKLSYKVGNDWVEAASTVPVVSGSSVIFKAEIDSADQNKYMLSSYKVNDKDTEYLEAGLFTKEFTVPVLENGKATVNVESEALAHDITFKWSDEYNINIDAANVVKYSEKEAIPTTPTSSGAYVDGTDKKNFKAGDIVTVRALDKKTVRFSVDMIAEKEVGTVVLSSGDSVTTYSDGYTFAPTSNGTFKIPTKPVAKKAITFNVSDASKISKIYAYVGNDGKAVESKTDARELSLNAGVPSVDVYPGENLYFEVEMADENYTVSKIRVDSKDVAENSLSYTYADVKKADDIYLVVGENTARYNTATLQYTDATISVTDDSTTSGNGKLDKEKTTVTVLPGTATSNTLRFTATPKTGYKIESITIDGEEYTLVENAPSQTVVVDFGSETVKKDNKEETVAKSGQNKLVKIVTVAKEAEADKRFKFALDGFGADQNKVSVDVTAASGVTDNGKTGSNKIYTVDAKSASEVFVTVTAPIKYKITGTDAINAVIEQGSSVSEKDQTVSYKFKINVSALTNAVAADKTTINPADVITFTGTIGKGELTISGAKLIKDADDEFISGSNQFFKRGITKGTKYVVVYDSYETLQIADGVKLDAAGNKTSEINWVDVTDFQEVDGNKETTITVTEDSAEYQVVNKNLTAYTVTATGSRVVNQTGINDETGILNAYTVKGGETVFITVTKDKAVLNSTTLKPIDDPSANTKFVVDENCSYKLVTSAKDAGKTFTFDIVNTETANGVSKDKLVTSFTLTIAPATATATAKLGDKVVENDSTIQIEAGTKTVLDVTYSSDIATGLLAVTPNTGAFQAYYDKYETDYSKLVLDASDMKAGATSTVAVKYDGKTIYSFKVEAKAPKLALKSFTVPNGGSTYVNVDMVPESITVSNEYTNAYYYEVYVKPTGTTTATGAKTGYYYIPVDPKWDADYKTYTFGEQAKQITVNTASKDTDTYAGTYELTARLVISNADIDETKLFSSVPSSVVAGGETLTATAATTAPKFEQNLKVKQTLKTMYTGQTAEVAELIYSDDTSYVANVSYEILNADGSQLNSDKVATPSGKLKITVPAKTKAGTYTVNVYSENSESKMIGKTESTKAIVQSKASFKIKVVSGINWIDAYVPATITQTGKKNVSVSVKATGYSGYGNVDKPTKAKTQKFTYEIVNNQTGAAKKNIDENVSISSSGKLVISKNFAVNANAAYNKFTVRITAADFEGNTAVIYRDVEVTSEAKELSSITLVDENGKALGDSVDFAQIDKGVYVKVKDTNNKEVALNDVKLTPSSGNVYITEDWNDEVFVGFKLVRKSGLTPKKTTLTVKATTTDGGKKTVKAKFTLTPADGKYVVAIGDDNAVEKSANNWTISNRGGKIWVNVFDGVIDDNHIARKDIYNYSVSVKGGKIIFANDYKASNRTVILPSAQEVKITLTDKTTKEKQVITVFDNTYPTTKAPKFSLVKGEKLSANLSELQVLDYNVSSSDYDAVYITQISSPKNVWAHTTYNGDYMNADGSYKIDDNGQFHISFRETSAKAGTLQYQATFGNYKDGIFVPATKPAKFNIKISKSQKIAVEENYTLNYAYKNYVELKGNQGFKLEELQNKNVDGKSNNFNTFFKISGNKIVLDTKSLIDSGKIKDVADIEKLVGSEDLSGYVKVSYQTGWDITRYCYNTVYAVVPVTIALSAETLAYTFTSSPVIASSTVYVDTKVLDANGKAIAFVTDSKSDVSTSTERASISAVGKNADKENIVTLRYTGAATAGTYPITYKILPEGSYYADFAKAKGTSYAVGKYGVDVTGNITAMDASATGLLTVNEDKQSINLADSSTDQAWVTSGKTKYGTYKAYLKLEDLFKNVDDDKIKTLSNDEKIASVSTTEAKVKKVELDRSEAKVRLAVTITSDNLDLTTVPVTFTTTRGASQVVNIAVKSTSQCTISQVGDLVKTYLEGLTYSSTMTSAVLKAGIEANVTENGGNAAASGVEVVSVSTPESTGSENNAYNVEVTLRSKTDSTNTATVTATITTAYKKVKFADIVKNGDEYEAINENIIKHILYQGQIVPGVGKKYSELDSDVKAQYYEVTADTTKAAIKTFIETRLSQLYSDADKYVVDVPTAGYNYEAAQLYEDGKVTFCYIIKDAKGNSITGNTISRKFDMTRKPVAEETK